MPVSCFGLGLDHVRHIDEALQSLFGTVPNLPPPNCLHFISFVSGALVGSPLSRLHTKRNAPREQREPQLCVSSIVWYGAV